MRRTICKSLIVSVVALGFLASAQAQNLIRKSAEFRNFDGTESFTTLAPPGDSIYTKTITADKGENILYITISATGDTHFGAASWFNCQVDSVNCNNGTGGADGAPAGWIALNKLPAATAITNCGVTGDGGGGTGDCHDNSITYQWCAVLPPASVATGGPHTVNLRMASSDGTSTVFIEAAHFYIDATGGSGPTCTAGVTGAAPVAAPKPQ